MFQILYPLIYQIQPFLIPLCFCVAWTIIILAILTVWSAIKEGVANAKRMHQIPCSHCHFFTNDYRLKCTIHPSMANSEQAISCRDYHSKHPSIT